MPCIIIGSLALLAAGLIFIFRREDSGYAIIFAISGALNIPVGILVSKYPDSPLLILAILGLLIDLMGFYIYICSFGFMRHIRSTVSSFIKSSVKKCKPFKKNNSKNINKYLFIALGVADILAFVIAIIVAGMETALPVLGAVSLIAVTTAVFIWGRSYKLAICYLAWPIISAIWGIYTVKEFFEGMLGLSILVLMPAVPFMWRNHMRAKEEEKIRLMAGKKEEAERKAAERREAERREAERKAAERKEAERKVAERREAERKEAEKKK